VLIDVYIIEAIGSHLLFPFVPWRKKKNTCREYTDGASSLKEQPQGPMVTG